MIVRCLPSGRRTTTPKSSFGLEKIVFTTVPVKDAFEFSGIMEGGRAVPQNIMLSRSRS
jgi:hypothetical protein